MMRPGFAEVTSPKVESVMLPSGRPNCAWLKALKNSARNATFMLSVMLVIFCKLMSQLLSPGPWKKKRGAFPSCPIASSENKEVLKYGFLERGLVKFKGPGVKLGVSRGSWIGPDPEVPNSEWSSFSSMNTGRPVEK